MRNTRIIALVLSVMLVVSVCMCAEAAYYDDSNGASWETAYVLNTSSDFMLMLDRISAGSDDAGKYYKLASDIDLTLQATWPDTTFAGHFDGQNHIITVSIDARHAGLFGNINLASSQDIAVRNLNVSGDISAAIYYYENFAGGIAYKLTSGIIESCNVSVDFTVRSSHYNDGATAKAGGIAGILYEGGTIRDCRFSGTILASSTKGSSFLGYEYAGGIVGEMLGGVIDGCRVLGHLVRPLLRRRHRRQVKQLQRKHLIHHHKLFVQCICVWQSLDWRHHRLRSSTET